jgi:dTDP-4-dehydrorhamnose 3,5-epimerase
METYSEAEFAKIGIDTKFVQDNHSKSKKWVLRGLHFQSRKPQAKLVRVTAWSVYDVVVDLRSDSPTFGKWEGFVLSAENKKQLLIPRWFAHGFLTLEDDTEFLYKCDNIYDSGYEWGIIWNDEDLWIDWQKYRDEYNLDILEISPKDQKNLTFESYKNNPVF